VVGLVGSVARTGEQGGQRVATHLCGLALASFALPDAGQQWMVLCFHTIVSVLSSSLVVPA
jgi:hypothetical protein